MEWAVTLTTGLVSALLSVLLFAMLGRAVFSWFDPMGESKIAAFLFVLTEPVIFPIRALCAHFHWFEGLPIDVPFMLTVLALMILDLLVSFLSGGGF